ncbi:hypothetical protein KP509_12G040000 [Ceratopteris richardii]|uniref:Uncharacterized protein n=1 Tax=Ceratopteris richardii TaxID=49495 RepID=A0A8T2TKD6_CERRI|nr:hypothetical protein KP509_12G040000 [Ceratopteris richardii]
MGYLHTLSSASVVSSVSARESERRERGRQKVKVKEKERERESFYIDSFRHSNLSSSFSETHNEYGINLSSSFSETHNEYGISSSEDIGCFSFRDDRHAADACSGTGSFSFACHLGECRACFLLHSVSSIPRSDSLSGVRSSLIARILRFLMDYQAIIIYPLSYCAHSLPLRPCTLIAVPVIPWRFH